MAPRRAKRDGSLRKCPDGRWEGHYTVAIPQQAVDLLVEDRKNHPDSPHLFPFPGTGGMWNPDAIG